MQLTRNLICLTLAVAGIAAAQQDPPGRVGRLGYMTGSVSFQPGGVDDWVPADPNRPLITGDHLWVDQNSRAEMHIGGSSVRLNAGTAFEFLNLDDQSVQIRLSQGSLEIHVRFLDDNQTFEVDTPNIAFSLLRPGVYRVDANPDTQTTYATVRSGQGEGTGGGQAFQVLPRQQAQVTGDQQISFNVVEAPGPDWFDTWGDDRDRREDQSQSARYCSREMVGYQDLDGAGSWRPEPDYGQVWYPNSMPAGWAPYRNGHWSWIQPWGWTWVDDMAWGFAPFHYGRWAVIGGSWGWVPGPMAVRPVYAPALVAFVGGSGFSLSIGGGAAMAWFPLGPHEVYVPSYATSPAYVNRVNVSNTVVTNVMITNIYNNTNVTNVRYVNQSSPGAVTAVSRETFVNARPVAHAVVAVRPEMLARAQVVRTAAVAPTQFAVLGHASMVSAPRPPAAALNRMVVTRATPPPAPVAFARQQQLLQQNPGRPLEMKQVQQIRAQSPAPARPAFRPAPVAKSVTPAPKNPPPAGPHPATAGAPPDRPNVAPRPPMEAPRPQVQTPAQPPHPVESTRPVEQPRIQPRPPERAVPAPEVVRPVERPAERPIERPAPTPPVEHPMVRPLQPPAERPAVRPAPTPPVERPMVRPPEPPAERPAVRPAPTPPPAERPMVRPAQPPSEHPLIKPAQPPPPAKPKPEGKDEKKKEDEKKKQDEKKQ